jgi:hypothetical protein
MMKLINRFVGYIAKLRGLPTLLAIFFVLLNFFIQFVPALRWLAQINLFLHIGVALGLFGLMLAASVG